MEVPGFAPGSARPSSQASTCVAEDSVLAGHRAPRRPATSQSSWAFAISHAVTMTATSSQPDSSTPSRPASGGQNGGRATCYLRGQSQVVVGTSRFSGFDGARPPARYLRFHTHVESSSPPNSQISTLLSAKTGPRRGPVTLHLQHYARRFVPSNRRLRHHATSL